jgi:cytoskeletal protein CcmA (bactofilin family)
VFSGRLHIPESKLTIGAGATVQFDNITCDEITVEGQVTLGTSLTAEKVVIRGAGMLTAPVVRAGQIEVSAGGSLQALIEKYVPREKPKAPEPQVQPEHPEEPRAEAA